MRSSLYKLKLKQNLVYLLFVGPALILFAIFILWPLLLAAFYSLRNWNGISPTSNFIGFMNFFKVFQEPIFYTSLTFTLKYTVICVVLLNSLGLFLALILNMNMKGRGILRSVFFMPMIISSVAVGYTWNFIITNFFPYLGKIFHVAFLEKIWLAYPDTSFLAMIVVSVWQMVGFYMIIYLAGLQTVPKDILEASQIDGASHVQSFFRITLPMIRPTFTICLFLSIVNGLKAFDLNYSLTNGGPYGSTQSLSFQIYLDAFDRNMMSYASAKAIIFCVIIAAVAIIQVLLTKKKEVEL